MSCLEEDPKDSPILSYLKEDERNARYRASGRNCQGQTSIQKLKEDALDCQVMSCLEEDPENSPILSYLKEDERNARYRAS